MIWVFDSSPLIYLNMVGLDWIFEQLEGKKLIPSEVYNPTLRAQISLKIDGSSHAFTKFHLIFH